MASSVVIGFCGDVMIGRAIDRIFPVSLNGELYENCIKHADRYIELAEKTNGELPKKEISEQGHCYIWGDLLHELRNIPNCLIINLETALTTNDIPEPKKGASYRCHPTNVNALKLAGVNVATLANDHVLDWKEDGLEDTCSALERAGILYAGAGRNSEKALRPTVATVKLIHRAPLADKKVAREYSIKVAAYGFASSGIPKKWEAGPSKYGINFIAEPSILEAINISRHVVYRDSDPSNKRSPNTQQISVVSLHWGPHWGWDIPEKWRTFAHTLIDSGIDIVVGHSSHHMKGIEVYKGKMIAYGLGDFINDYEGITDQGYGGFRGDLCCLYLPKFDTEKRTLLQLDIIPCKIKHLKVQRATNANDIECIRQILCNESQVLGTSFEISKDAHGNINLKLKWNA